MTQIQRTLSILPGYFSICRLGPHDAIPEWAIQRDVDFFTITQTRDELSIICPQQNVPLDDNLTVDRDWRCLKLEGPFDMDEPGVMAALATPLAEAGVSVFAEATYDTDYLVVNQLEAAVQSLESLGHTVKEAP